ncbi:peptidoglycan-binding protein [Nocardiopsis sp. MG754419]|uniref:peptidoglycan-binding protein n=1 Tax=Nocardiopsis sp. MG754419 TaxID=2259865 RepID=UPI001BA4E44D|nr:peptidoglycan-binding protein [Nocardiopsis sp. MG754419]MBR8741108.1 peptidoglycan-binding protein [Nocardiopsis sp. MG754419]
MTVDTDTDPWRDTAEGRPRPDRRGLVWLSAALVTLVVLCAGAVVTVRGVSQGSEEEGSPAPESTTEVRNTTLSREESLDGTLGHAGGGSFFARSDGVLTWLPEVGETRAPGQRVWEIDGAPVILLRGETPAYRRLEPGSKGPDVRLFEQALAELGYGGFTVDDEYTWLTAEAVRRWQKDTEGMEVTGTVDPDQIWYAPGTVRITGHEASLGENVAPATPLLATGSTRQVVRVDLKLDDRDLVAEGDEVSVELPGGETVTGEVESVGTVAEVAEGDERDGGAGEDPTVEVVIGFEEEIADFLEHAPVTVLARGEVREDVLAVPAGALIALAGGGYGLSVVGGDGRVDDVEVETGWFSDGLVEVTGDAISEGIEVVVPE